MINLLSFDVEDWFVPLDADHRNWNGYDSRLTGQLSIVIDILERFRTSATFFILADTALRHPQIVELIANRGHEIASHGKNHRFAYDQTPREFENDLDQSISILNKLTRGKILGYRAPYFSITRRSLWALDILANHGIAYDSSIFPVFNHRYGIPRAPRYPYRLKDKGLLEFPPSTLRVAGINLGLGGVYFRFLPFSLIRSAVRKINAEGFPAVIYLHPWEFDPYQPRLQCSPFLRFRHYQMLGQTAPRLKALLGEFSFAPLGEGINERSFFSRNIGSIAGGKGITPLDFSTR